MALLSSAPIASFLLALYWGHFVRQRRKMPTVVIAWSLGRGLFLVLALQFMPLVLQLLLLPFWGRVADRLNPMLTRTALSGIWGTKLPVQSSWMIRARVARALTARVPVPPPAIV